VVLALLSANDVFAATEQQPPLPLEAVPYLTVPLAHLPGGGPAIAGAAATNMRVLGLSSSKVMAKAPLRPPPGEWMRVNLRCVGTVPLVCRALRLTVSAASGTKQSTRCAGDLALCLEHAAVVLL